AVLSAAEQTRVFFREEGPCHSFPEAACGERAFDKPRALLTRGEDAFWRHWSIKGHGRDIVKAVNAQDFFHKIRFTVDIRAPAWHGDIQCLTATGDLEAKG